MIRQFCIFLSCTFAIYFSANFSQAAEISSPNPKDHWAFKAPVRPKIPAVKNKNWVRNPIDNFVLARLEKEKLNLRRKRTKSLCSADSRSI